MQTELNRILFVLLHSGVEGKPANADTLKDYCNDALPKLLKIATAHNIAHLLILGLKQNGLMPEENSGIEKLLLKTVFQHERMQREYDNLCGILEKAQIPFLPLKGAVLRKRYPEPWMRTSGDVDILVKPEDSQRVSDLLITEHGYAFWEKSSHDIALYTPGKYRFELHYDLIEDGIANQSAIILQSVWRSANLHPGYAYQYEMADEMFYFYHIAHMAKHFLVGGCGIRSFLDLWLLDTTEPELVSKRDALLEKGGLLAFAEGARKLSRVWFGDAEHTPLTRQMEAFILQGGTFGNIQTRVAIQQKEKGGRLNYILPKIFLPYEILKGQYPILKKHPWLTPVMEVRRWGKLIFCGHLRRTAKEIRYNSQISSQEAENAYSLLKDLGL